MYALQSLQSNRVVTDKFDGLPGRLVGTGMRYPAGKRQPGSTPGCPKIVGSGRLDDLDHLDFEDQILAGQRVVGVDGDFLLV